MKSRGGGRRRRRAQRTYRLLVRLYPAAHRREFGEQMVQTFGDHYRDAVEGRRGSRLRFWLAVVTDAGSSLLTEHAAEIKARRRSAPVSRRRPRPATRAGEGTRSGARPRQTRVSRRLRYHRRGRPVRVVLQIRQHRLVYRGRVGALIAVAVMTGVMLGTGTALGHLGLGALLAAAVLAVWLLRSLRLTAPVPAGPRGDGPAPPGGAAVREPRRPLPTAPAGSTARPRPDPDEPGQAVALI